MTFRRRCSLAGLLFKLSLLLQPLSVSSLAPLCSLRQVDSHSLASRGTGAGLSSSSSTPPIRKVQESSAASGTSMSTTLRIRRTLASDLPTVSSFLSTAAVAATSGISSTTTTAFNNNFWKTKMDQLWARYDYEGLLKRRLRAIEEGRKAVARMDAVFSTVVASSEEQQQQKLYLEHLWWSSDRLRTEIAAAAQETGEDSVWRRRGMQLAPESLHWLNHLQLTAITVEGGKEQVVGFVEVAMLSNPCGASDEECRIAVGAEDNNEDDNKTEYVYSPAITNLAVAPEYRRRGVGHRLLAGAEAYVARNWGASALGLYVQHDNVGANALYSMRGYQPQASLNDERLGRLWYRSKELKKNKKKWMTTAESKHESMEEGSKNMVSR